MTADLVRRQKPSPEQIQELRDLFSSRWMSVDELRKVEEESGLRFKRGKFSEKEKACIKEALSEFLQERGLTEAEFIDVFFNRKSQSRQIYEDKRFAKLFKAVAAKLDGRPILMTYQCIRRMYHPGNGRGRWSAEDDAELKHLFNVHGPDWETIGKFLDRYGMSCRDRFRTLRNQGSKGPWSEEEIQRLVDAIAHVRQSSNGQACWPIVAERVGTRSMTQCQVKWISLEMRNRNRGRPPRWTPQLDYALVARIYELAVEHESEIIWRDLVDDSWPQFFHQRAISSRWRTLKRRIRKEHNQSLDGKLLISNFLLIALMSVCLDILEALLLKLKEAMAQRGPLTPDFINDSDIDE